ncbi:MAG: DoxX family protein [Acidimicrobiia bacterium]|nr:DoxX family protein [Acidimicrobiia bacterium]
MEPIDVAALILRVVLGTVMLAHGIKHARGREKTSRWFGSIGFRSPQLQWFASTATEIGVGVLLIVGLGTSLAVAGLVGIMTVAFVSVHRAAGFWITARPDEGYEYVLTLTAAAAALAMIGPGKVSIDRIAEIDVILDGWYGLAAVGIGILAAALQLVVFFRPERGRLTA